MPGTNFYSTGRPGRSTNAIAPAATIFLSGVAERGPADRAVEARSLAEWESTFGVRTAAGVLWQQAKLAFQEGGVRVVTARNVGASATKGTRSLVNRLSSSPVPTLAIDARDPGPHSTRIAVEVVVGSAPALFTIRVYWDDAFKEEFADLVSNDQAVTSLLSSAYVRARKLADATAAPDNVPAPAAKTALSAGLDDVGAVTAATCVAGLALFGREWGTGVIAVPGYAPSAVAAGIRDHCRVYSRISTIALPLGLDETAAETAWTNVRNALAAGRTDQTSGLEYLTAVYPGVVVEEAGVRQTITAEGYTGAKRAKAIVERGGPWKSPAGEIGKSDGYVVDVERVIASSVANVLDERAHISVIRVVQNTVRLYGWRSAHPDTELYYDLVPRDVANLAQYELDERVEPLVHEVNGGPGAAEGKGALLARLDGILRAVGDELAQAGALYPRAGVDQGFTTDTGPSFNSPALAAQRHVAGALSIRPAPTAATIDVYVNIAAPTATL